MGAWPRVLSVGISEASAHGFFSITSGLPAKLYTSLGEGAPTLSAAAPAAVLKLLDIPSIQRWDLYSAP